MTSTSARVFADRFTSGVHVVMLAGVNPNGRILTPEVAPVCDARLQPLAGIRWTRLGVRRVAVAG